MRANLQPRIPAAQAPGRVAAPSNRSMFNFIILVVMAGILVSLGLGLTFLVRDRGKTNRTVMSLTVRVGLSVLLLALLAFGFAGRYMS